MNYPSHLHMYSLTKIENIMGSRGQNIMLMDLLKCNLLQ